MTSQYFLMSEDIMCLTMLAGYDSGTSKLVSLALVIFLPAKHSTPEAIRDIIIGAPLGALKGEDLDTANYYLGEELYSDATWAKNTVRMIEAVCLSKKIASRPDRSFERTSKVLIKKLPKSFISEDLYGIRDEFDWTPKKNPFLKDSDLWYGRNKLSVVALIFIVSSFSTVAILMYLIVLVFTYLKLSINLDSSRFLSPIR